MELDLLDLEIDLWDKQHLGPRLLGPGCPPSLFSDVGILAHQSCNRGIGAPDVHNMGASFFAPKFGVLLLIFERVPQLPQLIYEMPFRYHGARCAASLRERRTIHLDLFLEVRVLASAIRSRPETSVNLRSREAL